MQILHFKPISRLKNLIINCCLILTSLNLNAQFVTHGPVVGAVTDSSARVYVRTKMPQTFLLRFEPAGNPADVKFIKVETTPALDNSCITNLTGLQSNTVYNVSFWFGDTITENVKTLDNLKLVQDTTRGSFQTFPRKGEKGNYLFVTGSCQESENMKTFDVMSSLKPRMMLHTGDFTYPSYQMGDEYPREYPAIQESFRRRYQEKRMRQMLWNVPIAYVPDDDDGWGAARKEGITGVGFTFAPHGRKKHALINVLRIDSFPDLWRSNCMKGYVEYFPGYELKDSSDGFYHSFIMGNIEFIMMDTRFSGDCNGRNFTYDSLKNKWNFTPDSSVHIISPKQMNWVKERLKNSTADWKFLVMGLPFNQNLKHMINMGIKTQDVLAGDAGEKGTGFRMAISYSTYWAGFPHQSKELLDFISTNNIKDVIVVSGDTHHNTLDDGTNAGLPEMNASGLAVAGTHLAYYMNKFSHLMGYPGYDKFAWNHGGGGLKGNKNFKNQFGKIQVVGDEYVEMSVVDEDNITLGTMRITHSTKVVATKKVKRPHYLKKMERRYRNPRPTAWMSFAKFLAKIIFKQR